MPIQPVDDCAAQTHVVVTARPIHGRAVRLAVGTGSFWRRRLAGELSFPPAGGTLELAVPRGYFDSGVNEVLLRATGDDVEIVSWRFVDREEHDTSL